MFNIWKFFTVKKNFSYLLIVALVGFGLFSLVNIPKENAPEVRVPVGIVTTIYPGASAVDVENLITNKIEDRLANGLDRVSKITSQSRESVSSIVVEFETDADLDKSIRELKDEVDKAKPDIPAQAEDPFITEVNFADQPIITFAVSSDRPDAIFTKIGEALEDELVSIRGVSKVNISGYRERETQVVVSKEALNTFGLSITDVLGAIARSNATAPVGALEIEGVKYQIQFEGDIVDPSEIADLAVLNAQGAPIYIRDLAFVSDGLEEVRSFSRTSIDGNPSMPSLSFDVFKRSGGDITEITSAVLNKLEQLQQPGGLLDDFEVLTVYDTGNELKKDMLRLSSTGLQTVLLVMIILFLALGWREALVAGAAIPLSFVISFIFLNASGNTLNFVSLFSLILVVGILVDSAIVVVEGIHSRMKAQMDKQEAALSTIRTFHWPLLTGTLTTVAVFAPLFIVSGITGEFIATIPFTIIFVLLASLFVALGLIPLISSSFLRRRNTSGLEERQEKYMRIFKDWYRGKITKILGHKKRERIFFILLTVFFIVSLTFPVFGFVKVIFFPSEDFDFAYLEIELPEGSVLSKTDLEARRVEEILYQNSDVKSFVTTVGSSNAFSNSFESNTKLANIFLNFDEKKNRSKTSDEITDEIREQLSGINTSVIRVSQIDSGPPVGAPIVLNFLGDDLAELDVLVSQAAKILEEVPGAVDVVTSAKSDGAEFVLSLDKAKAAELGLDASTVASTLRVAVNGADATTIKTGDSDIDVVVKLNLNADYIDTHDTTRTNIDAIRQIEVPLRNGGSTLLGSVINADITKGSTVIRHEDQKRLATLSSQITDSANAREVLTEFEKRVSQELELPEGVVMEISGENDEAAQSFRDMLLALVIGLIAMLGILVLQFNSFRYPIYILAIVPLTLIGIMFGLAITHQPLSFSSIMGFIALSGIVVNNSIILIDKLNSMRRQNPEMPIYDLVIEGTASRLRPILLTTLTTVIGLVPLMFASALWAPLALAVIFGLSFAVIITLILIPVIYNKWPGKVE